MQGMEPVAIVTLLLLMQYFLFALLVGKARMQHQINAPAITGHPEFERRFRVHQNTQEQLVIFLPAMWLFAWYIDPLVASALGLVFIVGRFVYSAGYVAEPRGRAKGFMVGWLAQVVLMLGALIGAVMSYFG